MVLIMTRINNPPKVISEIVLSVYQSMPFNFCKTIILKSQYRVKK